MRESIITTKSLSKHFNNSISKQLVLKDLDLNIYNKEFTVIMGPSGAGKSTLMHIISGMDSPTSGEINFCGKEIVGLSEDSLAVLRRKNCGFVFQNIYLMDNMSIMDNILVSGLIAGSSRKNLVSKAKELFLKVKLGNDIYDKFPSQLSGGELQRAAIVRAIINNPKVVFADEPTGALNSAAGNAVLDVLTRINQNGQSIVMVTHDFNSAIRGSRILYLRDGVVFGECNLGAYNTDKSRREKLKEFLFEMGW